MEVSMQNQNLLLLLLERSVNEWRSGSNGRVFRKVYACERCCTDQMFTALNNPPQGLLMHNWIIWRMEWTEAGSDHNVKSPFPLPGSLHQSLRCDVLLSQGTANATILPTASCSSH